jgi:hypothetical protein
MESPLELHQGTGLFYKIELELAPLNIFKFLKYIKKMS